MIESLMALCPWEAPTYFIFSPNAYPLFYYAHFVPILVGGPLVAILMWQNSRSLATRLLAILYAISSTWIVVDLLSTATNRPDVVVFLWSFQVLIEPLLFAAAFFGFYAFATNRLPPFREQLGIAVLIAPLIALAPTHFNIAAIYLEDCNAEEGFIASHYSYAIEIAITLWILLTAIRFIIRTRDKSERITILLYSAGLLAFLVSFASGNLIGTITGDWVTAQYGLFGLPVFIGFLGYIIVRFGAFNIKMLTAQALVVTLGIAVLSLTFVESLKLVFIISIATFFLICALGWFLVRSVRREVEQRELIEKQKLVLQEANAQQENLLHFISHEIKGYLTNSEGAFAVLVEGDLGAISPEQKEFVSKALSNVRRGVRTVMDILKASDMKKGTVTYKKSEVSLKVIVDGVLAQLKTAIDEKHLTLITHLGEGAVTIRGDEEKLRDHVVRNLIDNAIKYTPAGTVTVSLSQGAEGVRFTVEDSGVGITPDDMARLFTEGGHGKDAIKVNVHSTGYGLFIAKQVVDAHGGKIWAETDGPGKGAKFIVEFPLA